MGLWVDQGFLPALHPSPTSVTESRREGFGSDQSKRLPVPPGSTSSERRYAAQDLGKFQSSNRRKLGQGREK